MKKKNIHVNNFEICFYYNNEIANIQIKSKDNSKKKYEKKRINFGENDVGINYDDIDKINQDSIKIEDEGYSILLSSINIKINLLNVKYFLTTGPDNQKLDEKPFYSYINKPKFKLGDIRNLLENEKIYDVYKIDSYKIKNSDGFFETIDESEEYNNNFDLVFEFHYNNLNQDPILHKLEEYDKDYTNNIINLKNIINKDFQNTIDYDLIYLYASPMGEDNENNDISPISYREEIKIISDLMAKKEKSFNCLIECIGKQNLEYILTNKKTKILHISSHGHCKFFKDKNNEYKICLENLNSENYGEKEDLKDSEIKKIIEFASKKNKKPINLIILSSCYSEGFKNFIIPSKLAKNIIYVDGKCPIQDLTCVKFTKYFYKELIDGQSISKSFEKAKKNLRKDPDISSMNLRLCCCEHHFHYEDCIFYNQNKQKHENYHKCKYCKNERPNIHKKDCQGIKEYKNEKNIFIKHLLGEKVKLCCCESNLLHDEVLKLKIAKENDYYSPFKFNPKGKLIVNGNACANFDTKKYSSIIGRKNIIQEINKSINEKQDNICFFIIYGRKGHNKTNFAESACSYLFERKVIRNYKKYIIESKDELLPTLAIAMENKNIFMEIKSVKIIKFIGDEESFNLNDLRDLKFESFKNYKNIYCFVLVNTKNEEEEKQIKELKLEYPKKSFNVSYNENSYYSLIKHLANHKINLIDKDKIKKALSENNNITPKKLEEIVNKCKGNNSDMLIKEIENIGKEKYQEESEPLNINEDKCYMLYLLAKMPNGLPEEILFEIFGENMNDEIDKYLIKDPITDWIYISEDTKKGINLLVDNCKINNQEIYKKCNNYLYETLKLYSLLLVRYIDKNRDEVCFKDNNIHFIFNSYNNDEPWKSQIEEIVKKEKKNIDLDDIEHHKENIYNLISIITKDLDNFAFKDIEKYLIEILLLFPSALFLKKSCIDYIKKCYKFCDKLKNEEERNKLKGKLSLFLYSINGEELNKREEQEEKNLIDEIRESNENSLEKRLDNLQKNKNFRINKKIYLINYEISKIYYSKSNYDSSKKYLMQAIKCLEEYILNILKMDKIDEKTFEIFKKIIDKYYTKKLGIISVEINYLFRMIIDSCYICKKENNNNNNKDMELINEKISYINVILGKTSNNKLFNESYNLREELYNLIEPDIIMLNSNPLKNKYSLLCSGIYAYPNNQYYILKKLEDKEKENNNNLYIKIKSYVLNEKNLHDTINKSGRKILIIQSDDFTENGDIVLETEKGQSKVLSNTDFIENYLPKKLNYQVLILCFKNSSKLVYSIINNSEYEYEYIIYFDSFDDSKINGETLRKYNKSCADFIIDFINISTTNQTKSIEQIFNEAQKNFNKFINKGELGQIKLKKYISITKKPEAKKNIEYTENQNNKMMKIFLYEPLPKLSLRIEKEYNDYSFEMMNIINDIQSMNYSSFYVENELQKQNYIKIGIEVMKFFYRHKTFVNYQIIDWKIGFKFKDIPKSNNLYLIYNCSWEDGVSKKMNKNAYIIIYDNLIDISNEENKKPKNIDDIKEKNSKKVENKFKTKNSMNKSYSIFDYDYDKDNSLFESSDSDDNLNITPYGV